MHKFIFFYNNNKLKVWGIILGIICILLLIQLFNAWAKIDNQNKNKEIQNKVENESLSYNKESESISTGEKISSQYGDRFGELLDRFLTNCVEHNYSTAYEMISKQTKQVLYKNETIFEKLYCKEKFEGKKQYSFQSWSAKDNIYIYLVKIYDDMLSSGKSADTEYIEDYVTVIPEEDGYKINVNSYIGRDEIYKSSKNEVISANVEIVDTFFDTKIYTISIKNNTDEEIILDTRKSTKSVYLVDENGNKLYALLYENKNEDFKFKPKESKNIQIKFDATYRDNMKIKSLNFENIEKGGIEYTLSVEI